MVKFRSAISPSLLPSAPSTKRFKGVRRRSWGRWVSEIRIPRSRDKIWLGSYSTPEKAARAFDAAVVLLRGSSSTLNFPDSPPDFSTASFLTSPRTIQATAAAAANGCDLLQMPRTDDDEELHKMAEHSAAELSSDRFCLEAECHSSLPASNDLSPSDESNPSNTQTHKMECIVSPLLPQSFDWAPCNMQEGSHEQDVFDDLFPFRTLSNYGFTAISGPVTISERFDIDLGPSADTCLWNL